MGLNKLIVVIGIAAFVMQPTNSASIGNLNNNCFCTREYFPICGTDDTNYSNECEFECAKEQRMDLDIKFYGQCEEDNKPQIEEIAETEDCMCTFILDPVCGNDGISYGSECELNCAKKYNRDLEIFTRGACVEIKTLPVESVEQMQDEGQCLCTREYTPVCSNEGITYSNQCMFNCAKATKKSLEIKFMGECNAARTLAAETDLSHY